MTQLSLFDGVDAGALMGDREGMLCRRGPVRLSPVAHAGDPVTSVLAADRHERSGARESNLRAVLEGAQRWPGRTSRELAGLLGMDRHEVARRLPELEKAGEVAKGEARRCTVGGTLAVVWVGRE